MCAVKILLAPITEFLRWTRFARIVQSHSGKSDVLAMWCAGQPARWHSRGRKCACGDGSLRGCPQIRGASLWASGVEFSVAVADQACARRARMWDSVVHRAVAATRCPVRSDRRHAAWSRSAGHPHASESRNSLRLGVASSDDTSGLGAIGFGFVGVATVCFTAVDRIGALISSPIPTAVPRVAWRRV